MNISLHIEQLILDGIDLSPHQRAHLQTAVETELTRLLAAEGLNSTWLAGGAVPQLNANSIQLNGESNPTRLGQQIARSVYGGIDR